MTEKFESDTLNEAYFDRNQAVMLLGSLLGNRPGFNVGIRPDDEWPILFIEFPNGEQLSWHIPVCEVVGTWPKFCVEWDVHSLEDKRQRMRRLITLALMGRYD